jgi:hypothetical protein
MLSQGSAGGEEGIEEHDQASPSEIPSTCVREAGQIEDRPSITTDHSVGTVTIGTELARVDG